MKVNNYIEPEFEIVEANCVDILTFSGGDPYNMSGDLEGRRYIKNNSWKIEI